MNRILVVGLGRSGSAVVAWAIARGADVVAVDDRLDPAAEPPAVAAARRAGARVQPPPGPEGWARLVGGVDLVVPSPGVRPAHPVFPAARRAGVAVRGDVDLAAEAARDRGVPVVAITGTNGKSTITTLAAAMLRADGRRVAAGGNLGPPALTLLEERPEVLVLEVSSFQLHATSLAFRPQVAVFANLAPDHLDWHGDFAAYASAKARVCLHQEPGAVLVVPAGDAAVAEVTARSRARRVTFRPAGATTGGEWWVADGVLRGPGDLRLPLGGPQTAPHDAANLAAAAAAAAAAGAGAEALARVAATPPPRLHHRLETVGQAGGVRYVDDSKATNPHATLAALRSFDRVVLIVGGDRKGVDLRPVGAEADRLRALVVIGADPADVEAALGPLPIALPRARARDMDEAVALAASFARPGDVVLCSPACASFDWYRSYAERGAAFRAAVDRLATAPTPGARRREQAG
jgi:UDP-N-acetylmuramoylalanine--D-glutamate ligase